MYLFPLTDFAKRFGISLTVSDFNEAVEQAARAATQDMISRFRLGGLTDYGTRRDFFFVDQASRQGTANLMDFYLSRPFVNGEVTAVYAPSPTVVRNNETDSFTDLSDTSGNGNSDAGSLDPERGVYSVFGLNLSSQWVVITYSAGLYAASDGVFENVPDWLAEAAMAQTGLNLAGHVMFQTEDETNDLSDLKATLARATADHCRWALPVTAYKPRFFDVL